MTSRIYILFFFLLFSLTNNAQSDVATELGVVPRPKKIELLSDKNFIIDDNTFVEFDKGSSKIAAYLSNEVQRATGFSLLKYEKVDNGPGIYLSVDPALNLKKEGYRLTVTKDRIDIKGQSESGVFYGVQTLLQLLPVEVFITEKIYGVTWNVPAVQIEDEPFFEQYRGIHIDVSRHFFNKEEIFQLIDYAAMHKLNTLHMHLTDDPGWRMEIKAFPKLTEIGAIGNNSMPKGTGPRQFFTQKELKEIIAYANARHIQVLPEVDMPGHMAAVIRAYPDLKSPKDNRKKPKVIRDDEKGLEFCKQVLREVKNVFGNVPIHIGFDEVNLGSKEPIYTDEAITSFAKKITKFIQQELDVTPIVWDDAFEKGLEDKKTLVQWWRPGIQAWWSDMELTMDQKLQKLNQPYILSPANWTYFDMKNAEGFRGAGWAGIVSVDKVYNWEPLLDLVDADPKKRSLAQGVIACTWSEQIPDMVTLQSRILPRLAALSEKAWAQPSDVDMNKPSWEVWRDKVLIGKQLKRYDALKTNYWSKNQPEVLRKVKDGKLK